MMKHWPIFFRWLTVAALIEWLIGRTLIRSAIYMPKTPLMVDAYQALGAIGQVAFTLTSLLAVLAVLWIAWQGRRNIAFSLLLITGVVFSLVFIFVMPEGWWLVIDRMLIVAIVTVLLGRLWRAAGDRRRKIAVTIPMLAVWLGAVYQLLPALAQALQLPEAPTLGQTLFNAGEILVALTPIALWLLVRPHERTRVYVLAAIPAILFSIMHLAAPAMISIMSIWSIGLTLYLPWPIYALSLWLGTVIVFSALKHDQPIGWALLLLLAAGYAPQVSTQVFISIIALQLLSPESLRHVAVDIYSTAAETSVNRPLVEAGSPLT
jgi:hypothetical protein